MEGEKLQHWLYKSMIDLSLSSEQELIKDTAKDFATTHLLPGVIERDEEQKFPHSEIKKMGE